MKKIIEQIKALKLDEDSFNELGDGACVADDECAYKYNKAIN